MSMSPFIHVVRFIAILSLITSLAAAFAAADSAVDLDAELAAALNARLEKLTVPESKFDDVPAQREAYVRKYRDGFAGTMKEERLPFHFGDDPILLAESAGGFAGRSQGRRVLSEVFAAQIRQLRADPGQRITKSSVAVRTAMRLKKPEDLQLLLERGADPDGTVDSSGHRHLHRAIDDGNAAAFALLLQHGADPNLGDNAGNTPLHLEVRHSGMDVESRIKMLLKHKADANAKNKHGRVPLHDAQTGEAALLLIKAGAKVDVVDANGNTPLHQARSVGVIDALLKNGAPLAAVNKKGERADSTPPVKLLLKHVKEQGSLPAEVWLHVMVKMNEQLPVNFERNKLVNILDYFRNTSGVNFYVDWRAINGEKIEQDTLVTLTMEWPASGVALTAVLESVAKGKLLWQIDAYGIVIISTPARIKQLIPAKPAAREQTAFDDSIPVNFEGNRLINVLDYMRNATDAGVQPDWAALAKVGVKEDSEVTLLLDNVPLIRAAEMVMHQLAGDKAVVRVHKGMLYVSTPAAIEAFIAKPK